MLAERIRAFFEVNEVIVNATYGEVFVLMGVALALQYRRHSSLRLARSVPWLAAFGLTHGAHEWGLVFIPIQATYLPAPFVALLRALQLVLLAVSFACLLQFGLSVAFSRSRSGGPVHPLTVVLLTAWAVGPFWLGLSLAGDLDTWRRIAEAAARYMLGAPGAFVSAWALYRQAQASGRSPGSASITPALRWAAFALAGYGVLGGLVVPQANFFPATVINQARLAQWVGVPVPVWRSALGAILLVAVIRSIEALHRELDRLMDDMEKARLISAERERIGRDLHDRTLQRVYSAGLLLQALQNGMPVGRPEGGYLARAIQVLDEAIADIRGYVSDLQPGDVPESLASRLRRLTHTLGLEAFADVTSDIDLPDRSKDARRDGHVYLVAAEALSNVARHSKARRVWIEARVQDGRLKLRVRDDGVGLRGGVKQGRGLENMHERARLLGGTIAVRSAPGRGTEVVLDVPWEEPA
ncbi:MAG: sensor histidine kinase [Bacillota bacterium]